MGTDIFDKPDERITRTQMLMEWAKVSAKRSTCSRAQVGAIIAFDGHPISEGYNGAPSGMDHCDHTCTCPELVPGSRDSAADRLGIHYDKCPADSACLLSVHAEANAIAFAARRGIAVKGAELFTTMAPCYICAQLIINSGITEVTYFSTYRDMSGVELLEQAGIEVWDFHLS